MKIYKYQRKILISFGDLDSSNMRIPKIRWISDYMALENQECSSTLSSMSPEWNPIENQW